MRDPMTRFGSLNMLGIIAMLLTYAFNGRRYMIAYVGFFLGMIVAKECLLRDWSNPKHRLRLTPARSRRIGWEKQERRH